MTKEEKDLLIVDLCARLPYKVIVEFVSYKNEKEPWFGELSCKDLDCFIHDVGFIEIKPFLFPLSSMTKMQRDEYISTCDYKNTYDINNEWIPTLTTFDWCNKNHFDYRGLIEKGLAIEVTEDNNPYKNNFFNIF